jgi:DNA-binding NarL/FixJ family response regulator
MPSWRHTRVVARVRREEFVPESPIRPRGATIPRQPDPDLLAAVGASLAERPYTRRGIPLPDRVIRVVLADDHTLFRAGLHVLLRKAHDIEVVGAAADGAAALALAERITPDVLVMDLDMPGTDGEAATRALADRDSPVHVLVLTMHIEEERLLPLLEAGASGYLTKEAAERELVDAIRVVASGDVYVRPRVARLLAAHQRDRTHSDEGRRRASFDTLSERERAVVQLTAEGYNGPEIGHRLGISPKTVDTYKQRIEEKLGMRHRTEYIRFALEAGLLHR